MSAIVLIIDLMVPTSLDIFSAAKSMSAVGRRSWYAASRTPPLRTKSWLLAEAARRRRKPSSAYRRRYSSLARPDFFAIARRSKYARPASVARVGGGVRSTVIAAPPGRAGVRALPWERLWRPRSVAVSYTHLTLPT